MVAADGEDGDKEVARPIKAAGINTQGPSSQPGALTITPGNPWSGYSLRKC
jgi:hypothetical protein